MPDPPVVARRSSIARLKTKAAICDLVLASHEHSNLQQNLLKDNLKYEDMLEEGMVIGAGGFHQARPRRIPRRTAAPFARRGAEERLRSAARQAHGLEHVRVHPHEPQRGP
jgi:hypothetical protein